MAKILLIIIFLCLTTTIALSQEQADLLVNSTEEATIDYPSDDQETIDSADQPTTENTEDEQVEFPVEANDETVLSEEVVVNEGLEDEQVNEDEGYSVNDDEYYSAESINTEDVNAEDISVEEAPSEKQLSE